MKQTSFDVFVSYSRKDSEIVNRIEQELNKHGINCFIDRSAIELGQDFGEIIAEAIYECSLVLFVWSENSNQSDNTANEIALAIEFEKTVVSFKIGSFKPSPKLAYRLVRFNRIDAVSFNEEKIVELGAKIAKLLDKKSEISHKDKDFESKDNIDSLPVNTNAGALIRIHPDMECRIEKFGENLGVAAAGQYFPIRLRKGKHVLKFISTQDEHNSLTITHIVEDIEIEDFLEIHIAEGAYEGEIRKGLRWGKGKCVYSDGTIYEGEWENDVRKGKGILTYADGRQCEGEFVDDKFNIYINETNFPDKNFRNLLKRKYGKEGILMNETIKGIVYLDIHSECIKSLKGIEFFSEIAEIDCRSNLLTFLDVSRNTKLEKLSCSYNLLTSLDVSNNTELTELYCSGNRLAPLDVSRNAKLALVYCKNNGDTSLKVLGNNVNAKIVVW